MFSAQGDLISVKLAVNTGDSTSAQTLGLAAASIAASAEGVVICQGVLTNVNTSTYTAGQALYLGATAGAITTTKPYAPNHLVYLGFVEKVNASSGRIYVRVQNGYELDEIHDVNINHNVALANKDYIVYNVSNDLWENRQLEIVNDTSPDLGGNLNGQGYTISNVATITATNITASGNITGNTAGFTIGYLEMPQVSAGNVTLALTNSAKHYYSTAASPTTITVPSNANVAFPTGTVITVVNQGTGNITLGKQAEANVYLAGNSTSATRTITTYGVATLIKVATNNWFVNGTGVV